MKNSSPFKILESGFLLKSFCDSFHILILLGSLAAIRSHCPCRIIAVAARLDYIYPTEHSSAMSTMSDTVVSKMSSLIKFGLPPKYVLTIPPLNTPVPQSPFNSQWLTEVFLWSMKASTPITIAIVYFTSVHLMNTVVRRRQLAKYNAEHKTNLKSSEGIKRLPAAPYAIANTKVFKVFVFFHNLFLCVYSVWTFFAMIGYIGKNMNLFKTSIFPEFITRLSLLDEPTGFKKIDSFWHTICDSKNGVFSDALQTADRNNLSFLGWWFYMLKFYEVIDTIIILLKGRPSSLLQLYHHSGAMMCMWSGVRYLAPAIWIFVVFNSFIHSLMYFYFTLSCLKIRVPMAFKRMLTTMQITQFIVGGSLAVINGGVKIADTTKGNLDFVNCFQNPDQAFSLLINVGYLAPLTMLFGAFYVESYLKKQKKA